MLSRGLFDISGKVALVTGGSRGIGRMITEGLVTNGVRTYITSRKREACDATARELSTLGECISLPADLSDPEALQRLAGEIIDREHHLDLLVNNAGAAWGAPLGSFPVEGIDKVLAVNLRAPLLLTQALIPLLAARATPEDPARVIMIGSIDGLRVPPGDNFSYSASKAGLHMLTRHLAAFVTRRDITVNAIAPGPFESKMMAYILDDPGARALVETTNPRGRIGSPEDIVGAVIFLASRAGAYVTGAVIPVDGGSASLGSLLAQNDLRSVLPLASDDEVH